MLKIVKFVNNFRKSLVPGDVNSKFDYEIKQEDFDSFDEYWEAVCWRNGWGSRPDVVAKQVQKFGPRP